MGREAEKGQTERKAGGAQRAGLRLYIIYGESGTFLQGPPLRKPWGVMGALAGQGAGETRSMEESNPNRGPQAAWVGGDTADRPMARAGTRARWPMARAGTQAHQTRRRGASPPAALSGGTGGHDSWARGAQGASPQPSCSPPQLQGGGVLGRRGRVAGVCKHKAPPLHWPKTKTEQDLGKQNHKGPRGF